ncbi:MAG: hypothetical protein QJR03_09410 [Sphaerobacter sp.]|nr:hypothetical protein [Sphaerobacter sp.]
MPDDVKRPPEDENPIVAPDELLREDPETAYRSLTRNKRDRAHGDIQRPPRNDPRHADANVPPGHANTPAGGTSGSGMGGGSSKRRSEG